MVELVVFLAVLVPVAVVAIGLWRRGDHDVTGDARSVVKAGADGTMTVSVTNPGLEPVVVTACARPAGRFRLFSRNQLHRALNPQERRNSLRAARQLLGSVAPGGQASWTVIGDASTRPACRVLLSLYQANGRVRVHEQVVRTQSGLAQIALPGRRTAVRPQHDAA